jgi:filamentous hemagglutinin family protein
LPSLLITAPVFAEGIATDGSVGAAQTLTGNSISVPQELGKTLGNNLFHSFSDFNINTGQTVTFSGSDSLQNVISRVTGNNPSVIDGTLKSDIKNADFYFINPHGITFNANAQVDVPAAFHVSTADKMNFGKNSGVFYADISKDSQLSSEPPSAFGFLGNSTIDNGVVDIKNARLTLKDGKTFDVVAGGISMEGKGYIDDVTKEAFEPTVKSMGGEARLVAFNGRGDVSLQRTDMGILTLPIENNTTQGGGISIDGGYVDTSGDGTGRVSLYGGDINLMNGKLGVENTGGKQAGYAKGIEVSANNLKLNGGELNASANNLTDKEGNLISKVNQGNASNINVSAINSMELYGVITKNTDGSEWPRGGDIISHTSTNGNAGSIKLNAKNITLNGGEVSSSSTSAYKLDSVGNWTAIVPEGNAGSVILTATNSILLNGVLSKYSNGREYQGGGSVFSDTETNGNAGTVEVNARNIILNGGSVYSAALNSPSSDSAGNQTAILTHGNAGNVRLNATDSIVLNGVIVKDKDGSEYMDGSIMSDTNTNGNAGNVEVNAKDIVLNSGSISSSAVSGDAYNYDSEGNATVQLTNGNAGSVTLNAIDSILLNGVTIKQADGSEYLTGEVYSSTEKNGNSGIVQLSANNITLNGGVIYTFANMAHNWDAKNNSTTEVLTYGNSGDIKIKVNQLNLNGKSATIDTSTLSLGNAGKVDIKANEINVYKQGSILSGSWNKNSSGQTGAIKIDTRDLNLKSGGTVTIKNEAVVENNPQSIPVGTIDIHAKNINIDDALITSESTGNVNAGNIHINYDNLFKLNNKAFINATSVDGNGGYISINSPSGVLSLKNSRMATTATGAVSNGGNIDINSDIMIMNTASLLASTVGGTGGNITLNLQSLVPSSNNLIEVGSKQFDWKPFSGLNVLGASGSVKSNVPQLNLSGVLVNITNTTVDNNLISQDYCTLGQGSSLSKKGRGALPYRPRDLQVY